MRSIRDPIELFSPEGPHRVEWIYYCGSSPFARSYWCLDKRPPFNVLWKSDSSSRGGSEQRNDRLGYENAEKLHCLHIWWQNLVLWNIRLWKVSNFPTNLILREIDFNRFQKVKTANFNHFWKLWFLILAISNLNMSRLLHSRRSKKHQNNQDWRSPTMPKYLRFHPPSCKPPLTLLESNVIYIFFMT